MILSFSDVHLGIKSYSKQLSNGLFTAEEEARFSLNAIYERAKQPDIDLITFGGDFFHSNQPSSENIKFAISWIKKIDKLGKPFYIIPGNHDASIYSSGLVFVDSLVLKNTFFVKEVLTTVWKSKWDLIFVPYISPYLMKNKEQEETKNLVSILKNVEDNTIVVAHAQESSCKLGSESIMINKGVDTLDIANLSDKVNLILLLGHIHRHQIYKKGSVTVCYSGNTFYLDESDANQSKGYCLIDDSGNITFEAINGLRLFTKVTISRDQDVLEFFKLRRISENQVFFIEIEGIKNISSEKELEIFLKNHKCDLGHISYISEHPQLKPYTIVNNFEMLKNLINQIDIDQKTKDRLLLLGQSYIEKATELK